mgnify:CR=1 FL=1
MGNSRLILAINGFLMIILGISFWTFPDFFSLAMFPNIEKNNENYILLMAGIKKKKKIVHSINSKIKKILGKIIFGIKGFQYFLFCIFDRKHLNKQCIL